MLILYSHTNAFFNNSQYDLFVNFMIIIFICCTHFTPICNITLYTSLLFIERIHVLNVTTEMVSISFATFRTLKVVRISRRDNQKYAAYEGKKQHMILLFALTLGHASYNSSAHDYSYSNKVIIFV